MAIYRLNDIAPIQQGDVPESDMFWLLNLDMVESVFDESQAKRWNAFDDESPNNVYKMDPMLK